MRPCCSRLRQLAATLRALSSGLNEQSFLDDSRTTAAVAMHRIVIGESARSLSSESQTEAPEIPWPQTVALRNRIAHGYQSIDRAAIWSIVQTHLPPLRGAVLRMLAARGEAP